MSELERFETPQSGPSIATVLRARSGDQAAMEALIVEYQGRMARFVISQTRDQNNYEDLCQTIFVKMVLALPRLKVAETFEAWLFKIARNACIDHLRGRRWWQKIFVPMEPHHTAAAAAHEPEIDHRARAVDGAIARLPADQRDLLTLSLDGKRSYEELARMSNLSLPAFKSRLFRARERLRQILRQGESQDET